MAKPLGYKILIEIPKVEEKTKGGIILSEDYTKKEEIGQDIGIVRALGPIAFKHDKLGQEPWVKEGDIIYYQRYSGHVLTTKDGKRFRFINDEDIYGLVESTDREELPHVD